MRHGNKVNALGRKTAHRAAMLSNMAISLIMHKRIFTTVAKAKELRKFVEPLVTKSKGDNTHNRRVVFSYLQNKEAIKELFSTVAVKVADRPGGYTRILKTHARLGDNAEMCMMELVDFNEMMLEAKAAQSGSTASTGKKRTRRAGKKTETTETVAAAPAPKAKAKSTADDLTKIEGVGPKIAETLVAAGLDSYTAIAASTPEQIKEILDNAEGNFAAHDPSTWTKQAEMAAAGQWDELKALQDELDGGKEA
jgi:large subunit ribosomal protein L17